MQEFILIRGGGGELYSFMNIAFTFINRKNCMQIGKTFFGGVELSALMDGNREGYGCPVVVLCGCYRVCASLTGRLQCTPWNSHEHPVITMYIAPVTAM